MRTPCERSANCRSKWKLKGELETGAFAWRYKYLPERPSVLMAPAGCGIWMKLFAEIEPLRLIALRPISLANIS